MTRYPDTPRDRTDAEGRSRLGPMQHHVLREKGTERAWTGPYNSEKHDDVYRCAACGQPLFRSEDEFDSGSGWPGFTRPMAKGGANLPIQPAPW